MIVPRSAFEASGERIVDASSPRDHTLDLLADPAFVTAALGDLVDADPTQSADAPLWVLPSISVGGRGVRIVLEPTWSRPPETVSIDAIAVPPSDVDLRLGLVNTVLPRGTGCAVHTSWRLKMWVPLPRPLASALGPALDASVNRVVDRIMDRIVAGVERA